MSKLDRNQRRNIVHRRVRKKVRGSAERPRLAVFRSLQHIYVQAIDDEAGVTLAHASTAEKDLRAKSGGTVEAAKTVGALIGQRLKEKGVQVAAFDRGGYLYHGRIQALAEGARSAGLSF